MVSAKDVSALRAQTGAGYMDCKNALEEANGDIQKAGELLREKGIVKAAKRAGRIAAEGKIVGQVSDNGKSGSLVEVNSETDFVAKGDDFSSFASRVSEVVLKEGPADLNTLASTNLPNGLQVSKQVEEMTMKIGEKINVRRFVQFVSTEGKIHLYLHGAKIGVLLELVGGDDALGQDVAMHIAAVNPQYLNREVVPTELIEKERVLIIEQLKQDGKPPNIIENIVKGKLNKFYSEICLLEQPFIKNEDQTIEKFVASKGGKVVRFARYELGEGIEKEAKDFAAEVAEQVGE